MDTCKSMGPDGMHLRVLKELVDVTVRLSSTISGSSWQMEEISVDWRKAKKTKQNKTKQNKKPKNPPSNLESSMGTTGHTSDTTEF